MFLCISTCPSFDFDLSVVEVNVFCKVEGVGQLLRRSRQVTGRRSRVPRRSQRFSRMTMYDGFSTADQVVGSASHDGPGKRFWHVNSEKWRKQIK